jgi:hypothetical protein
MYTEIKNGRRVVKELPIDVEGKVEGIWWGDVAINILKEAGFDVTVKVEDLESVLWQQVHFLLSHREERTYRNRHIWAKTDEMKIELVFVDVPDGKTLSTTLSKNYMSYRISTSKGDWGEVTLLSELSNLEETMNTLFSEARTFWYSTIVKERN